MPLIPDPVQTIWLRTLLVLVVVGAGIWLHLKWHPLKTHFGVAWRILHSNRWLIPFLAALHLLSPEGSPWAVPHSSGLTGQFTPWQQILSLLPLSVREVIILMHGLAPPHGLSIPAPILFFLAAYHLMRYPHHYGQLRLSKASKLVLIIGISALGSWVLVGLVSLVSVVPEWLVGLRNGGHGLIMAWAMTVFQVFMIRVVMHEEARLELSDRQNLRLALKQTLVQWRGILALTLLNSLLILGWSVTSNSPQYFPGWMMTEAGFIFAVVPLVVAWVKVAWPLIGEVITRVFMKTWLPLLGFILTASFLLVLVHVSMRGLFSLLSETAVGAAMIHILFALVLATVRSWLFLTFVLTLFRHGLKAAAPGEAVN